MFRNNPWLYGKKCCSGGSTQGEPAFNAETAYAYFRSTTSNSHQLYQPLPQWMSQVMPTIKEDELIEFDLSAITPGTIRKVLKGCPYNSSPGEDDITYHHPKELPPAHYFLATLFSNNLLENHVAPQSWLQAKIKLIHKCQDLSSPENFSAPALIMTSACSRQTFQ